MFVITQFWVIPQNSLFFKIKNQKNKIKAGNVEKADKKGLQKQAKIKGQIKCIFEGQIK